MEIQYIFLIFGLHFALILTTPVRDQEVKAEEATIAKTLKDVAAIAKTLKDVAEEKREAKLEKAMDTGDDDAIAAQLEAAMKEKEAGDDKRTPKDENDINVDAGIVSDIKEKKDENDEESEDTGDGHGDIMEKIIDLNEKVRAGGASVNKESDIKETEEQRYEHSHNGHTPQGDLVAATRYRWTEKDSQGRPIVPYVIATPGQRSAAHLKAISDAIAHYKEKTCIQFVPRNGQRDYVNFISAGGCYSYVGRVGRKQDISLQDSNPGCNTMGIAVHEMMHALGYYHEQSRSDRDQYVTINLSNVRSGMEHNFDKRTDTTDQGTTYDYASVMHYGAYAFAVNRNIKTITPKGNPNQQLGQRNGLSTIDAKSLNDAYCQGITTTVTTTTTSTTPTTTTTTTTTPLPPNPSPVVPGPGGGPFSQLTCNRCKRAGLCNACEINKACADTTCKNNPRYANSCVGWSTQYCLGRFANFMANNCAASCQAKYCENV
jgi:choriolysin H